MWNPKKEQTRPNLMDTDSWLPEANKVGGGKIGEGGINLLKRRSERGRGGRGGERGTETRTRTRTRAILITKVHVPSQVFKMIQGHPLCYLSI